MTTEQFRALHQVKPFKPFTVHLADGSHVKVPHPEMVFQTQGGRTIFVNTTGETVEIIDLLLVTKITTANGTPKRRR